MTIIKTTMMKLNMSVQRWVGTNEKPGLRGNHAFLALSLGVKVDSARKYEHRSRTPTWKEVVVVVVVVSHIQRIGCQPEKNYFTRWPIPLVVC